MAQFHNSQCKKYILEKSNNSFLANKQYNHMVQSLDTNILLKGNCRFNLIAIFVKHKPTMLETTKGKKIDLKPNENSSKLVLHSLKTTILKRRWKRGVASSFACIAVATKEDSVFHLFTLVCMQGQDLFVKIKICFVRQSFFNNEEF